MHVPIRIAVNYKIPLVMYGENGELEYGGSMKNLTNSALSYGAIATLASLPALCFAVIFKRWHWWWMPIH